MFHINPEVRVGRPSARIRRTYSTLHVPPEHLSVDYARSILQKAGAERSTPVKLALAEKVQKVLDALDENILVRDLAQWEVDWSKSTRELGKKATEQMIEERLISGNPAPETWQQLMREVTPKEREQVIRILRAAVPLRESVTLAILRERVSLGEFETLRGFSEQTYAFLYLITRRIEPNRTVNTTKA